MNCGVYRIRNTVDGKCYIGSSNHIQRRWKAHRFHLTRGTHHAPHLMHAWAKHGADRFAFEVLLVCSEEMLLFYEQRLIDGLKPVYNTCQIAGSCLGRRYSQKVREEMSARARGWRQKYDYQGEQLCLTDIAERAGVPQERLISRVVGLGMTLERALEQPPREKRLYEYQGRTQTATQWAAELGMHPRRIAYWLDAGMTISDCVARLNREAKAMSFPEFCRISGVNLQTMKSRVQAGMPLYEALTLPVSSAANFGLFAKFSKGASHG